MHASFLCPPFAMTHALDLPEVRSHIAQFLALPDLAAASRVSQDWNQACLPFLWRTLNVTRPSGVTPRFNRIEAVDKTTIRRHACHLRILRADSLFGSPVEQPNEVDVRDVYFPKLEDFSWSALPHDQAVFIHCHRLTLVRLDLYCRATRSERAQRESEELWPVLASCPKLESLAIDRVCVSRTTWPACWSLWSRLTSLGLSHIDFSPLLTAGATSDTSEYNSGKQPASLVEWFSQANACPESLRIKTLYITHHEDMGRLEDELSLLRFCPDLETLHWNVASRKYDSQEVAHHLAEHTRPCPNLIHVNVHERFRSDVVVPFLETKVGRPLQGLHLWFGFFGQAAWDLARKRYTSSLRSLDLWNSITPDGIVHDILCTLPSLVSLTARYLKDQHLINDHRPWVCLGLKRLELGVNIDGDSSAGQELVMKRLGTLTSLRYLEVPLGSINRLLFRRSLGLEHLGNLKCLRELFFNSQNLTEDDVRWMVDHWPQLSKVIGPLNQNPDMSLTLKRILEDAGVATHRTGHSVLVC